MAIQTFLDLSTGHIQQGDAQRLEDGESVLIIHAMSDNCGWFIYVDSDNAEFATRAEMCAEFGFSPEFINLMRRAHDLGCWYLRLDSDGPLEADLPTFDWI